MYGVFEAYLDETAGDGRGGSSQTIAESPVLDDWHMRAWSISWGRYGGRDVVIVEFGRFLKIVLPERHFDRDALRVLHQTHRGDPEERKKRQEAAEAARLADDDKLADSLDPEAIAMSIIHFALRTFLEQTPPRKLVEIFVKAGEGLKWALSREHGQGKTEAKRELREWLEVGRY